MAALSGGGRVASSWSNNYGLYFEWNASQNVAGNYSEITFTVYADFLTFGTIQVGARNDGLMSIAGQQQTVYMPAVTKLYNGNAKIKLATIKKRVNHNSDGTLPNVQLKAIWPIRATIAGTYRSTIEGTYNTGEVTRIPRASEVISSADFTLENNLVVNLKRYSDEFKHDIVLKINGANFKTITNVGTSTTFTFNSTEINNLYTSITNRSSVPTELVVVTKQNSTTIGTTSKIGTMYIDPIKNAPTFADFEFKPDSKTTSATGWSNYVNEDNGLSILGHTIYTIKPGTTTAKNGATISHYEISLNNKNYRATGSEFILPNPIVYNDNLTVYAVDSRGFKTAVIKNISGQQYEKIKFTKLDVKRRNYPNQNQINFDISGSIFKNDDVVNTLSAQYRSREVGGSFGNWVNITSNFTVGSNGNFSANFNQSTFDTTKSYELEIQISDLFTSETFQIFINREIPVVTISENELKANGDVNIAGALQVNGGKVISESNLIEIVTDTYGKAYKFADGTMIVTQSVPQSIVVTNLWGGIYTSVANAPDLPNFPVAFITPPFVMKNVRGNGNDAILMSLSGYDTPTTTTAGRVQIARGTPANPAHVIIDVFAIGRWK